MTHTNSTTEFRVYFANDNIYVNASSIENAIEYVENETQYKASDVKEIKTGYYSKGSFRAYKYSVKFK